MVLGHGLGCLKEMRLDAYAQRFAEAGYVALAFDYRHFGASGGTPRQLLDIDRQLGDWHAAIGYARQLPDVDPDRIAVFGTSFSGGHVLEVAKSDRRIAAVISQCPFTTGAASTLTLGAAAVGAGALAAQDLAATGSSAKPVMIPLAGDPGDVALMNAPDVKRGYFALVPPGVAFVNAVPARIAARIPFYTPGAAAAAVTSPIFFAVCDKDSVAPPGPTLAFAATAPRATIRRYPVGHFEIYLGEAFRRASADYVAFLERTLPTSIG